MDFYGIDEDVAAFGQFIYTYVNRNDRWNSPKFLIGESYGTFRSAALGNYLQNFYNMHLNGICLISSVLDLSSIEFQPGDDRVYVYYLPSYAAVAWYHKVLKDRPADLPAFVDEARKYAEGDYATALFKGARLTPAEKKAVAKKLSYFTGLSEDYLMNANLRVTLGQFNAELQRSRGMITGRIDARFSGYARDLLAENSQGDPEGPAVGGAFTAMLNQYNHDELKFGEDKVYHNTSGGGGWNWTRRPQGFGGGGGGFPGAPNVEARSRASHDHQSQPYRGSREWLLRFRHAVFRHGVHREPPLRVARRTAEEHQDELLPGGTHDVPRRSKPRDAAQQHRRLYRSRQPRIASQFPGPLANPLPVGGRLRACPSTMAR